MTTSIARAARPRGARVRGIAWAAALVLAAGACDPAWSLAIRQPVTLAVAAPCVAAALAADPRVENVSAGAPSEDVSFALRDSTTPGGKRSGSVEVRQKGGRSSHMLATLEVSVMWRFPAAGIRADSTQTRALEDFARSAAERIRSRCAPSVPSGASCHVIGAPLHPGDGCLLPA